MTKAPPLWLAAVVPATLAGHGIAYALCACSSGEHHSWFVPVLDFFAALFLGALILHVYEGLRQARVAMRVVTHDGFAALFLRLAVCQSALFVIIEHLEGARADMRGVIVQLALAVFVAYALRLFARLLTACVHAAHAAAHYLQRIFAAPPCAYSSWFTPRNETPGSYVVPALFQRPPPRPVT